MSIGVTYLCPCEDFYLHRIVCSWVLRVIVGLNCTDRPESGTLVPVLWMKGISWLSLSPLPHLEMAELYQRDNCVLIEKTLKA